MSTEIKAGTCQNGDVHPATLMWTLPKSRKDYEQMEEQVRIAVAFAFCDERRPLRKGEKPFQVYAKEALSAVGIFKPRK